MDGVTVNAIHWSMQHWIMALEKLFIGSKNASNIHLCMYIEKLWLWSPKKGKHRFTTQMVTTHFKDSFESISTHYQCLSVYFERSSRSIKWNETFMDGHKQPQTLSRSFYLILFTLTSFYRTDSRNYTNVFGSWISSGFGTSLFERWFLVVFRFGIIQNKLPCT